MLTWARNTFVSSLIHHGFVLMQVILCCINMSSTFSYGSVVHGIWVFSVHSPLTCHRTLQAIEFFMALFIVYTRTFNYNMLYVGVIESRILDSRNNYFYSWKVDSTKDRVKSDTSTVDSIPLYESTVTTWDKPGFFEWKLALRNRTPSYCALSYTEVLVGCWNNASCFSLHIINTCCGSLQLVTWKQYIYTHPFQSICFSACVKTNLYLLLLIALVPSALYVTDTLRDNPFLMHNNITLTTSFCLLNPFAIS